MKTPHTTTSGTSGKTVSAFDDAGEAIKTAKRIVSELHDLSVLQSDKLDALWDAINRVRRIDDAQELVTIQERIDRLQELRRMAECGSFMLAVNTSMDAAWRRLP